MYISVFVVAVGGRKPSEWRRECISRPDKALTTKCPMPTHQLLGWLQEGNDDVVDVLTSWVD